MKNGFPITKEIQFPIKHEGDNCNGLIHLEKEAFSDDYSMDINLIFICKKCNKKLNVWTEGELIDNEFKEIFNFTPK